MLIRKQDNNTFEDKAGKAVSSRDHEPTWTIIHFDGLV